MTQKPVSLETRAKLFDKEGKPTINSGTQVTLEHFTVIKSHGPWLDLIDKEGNVLRGHSHKNLGVTDVHNSVRVYGKLCYNQSDAADLYVEVEATERYN